MIAAGALRMSHSKEGKPRDLADLAKTLVQGASKENDADDSDNEYLDEQWWDSKDDQDIADGPRGDH